jgi:acyl carrier protein phosphodiesterase
MNFLAHLFLSHTDEPLLVGNFLTDFLNKQEAEALPVSYHRGVAFHRLIDTYTDQHPSVMEGVKILQPYHRKYASVVIDVFYDYFLIQNWTQFTDEAFPVFRQRVYHILTEHLGTMPPTIRPRVISMVDGDWLASYGEISGLLYAIDRLSRRASRPEWLLNAADSLAQEKVRINASFLSFFPDLIKETRPFCS